MDLTTASRHVVPAGATAPFSNAAIWGDLVVTAGQLGDLDPIAPDVETQARQALTALDEVLRASGAALDTVLRIEAFLHDGQDFHGWNAVFQEYFPTDPPARTTIVTGLALPGLLIEVQAIAGRVAPLRRVTPR